MAPLLFIGFIMVGFHFAGGNGAMATAERLRPQVEAVPDPESLPSGAGWSAVKCTNGEWILGTSVSSHEMYAQWYGGGTVVLKDSRGRVRCFLGHVCGRWDIEFYGSSQPFGSLDEIDAVLAKSRYAEEPWP